MADYLIYIANRLIPAAFSPFVEAITHYPKLLALCAPRILYIAEHSSDARSTDMQRAVAAVRAQCEAADIRLGASEAVCACGKHHHGDAAARDRDRVPDPGRAPAAVPAPVPSPRPAPAAGAVGPKSAAVIADQPSGQPADAVAALFAFPQALVAFSQFRKRFMPDALATYQPNVSALKDAYGLQKSSVQAGAFALHSTKPFC
jgi:hypothetical protein